MSWRNRREHHPGRAAERARDAGLGQVRLDHWRIAQNGTDTSLFPHLPESRFVREFVWFDVAAWRQPPTQLGMPVEQDAATGDDEDGDREIPRDRRLGVAG